MFVLTHGIKANCGHEHSEQPITRYVSGKSPLFFSSLMEDSRLVGRWAGVERGSTFGHAIFKF